VERLELRRLLTPELILLAATLFVAMALIWRSSSTDCQHWKQQLSNITGGYLASAGEREFPASAETQQLRSADVEAARRAAKQVIDARPFGCF
jgi:hypothetical protein